MAVKRFAFNSLAALSLLLCVAVCVLWVRNRNAIETAKWIYGRSRPDRSVALTFITTGSSDRLYFGFASGQIPFSNGNIYHRYRSFVDPVGPRFVHTRMTPWRTQWPLDTPGWGPVRWTLDRRSRPAAEDDWFSLSIGISHWLLALLLLVLPTLWLMRWRRARRIHLAGLCPTCGYDLRATPDRCPECGTAAGGAVMQGAGVNVEGNGPPQ